ncbi:MULTISPECIES: RyR domain-containing protein [unclassified Acinetobacter]|uniref:RyR domain-containing protein n=1 Tax=unclassified Acinetobacter TaxID=196816 RepID=UPI002576E261|nr:MULTISPECIES: RyR domain-containing protein [unclassified Acinetobacter]MDM1757189.1 hypothetical protein [Acinetobacter sp. 256-1]MDM1760026.1 hypothetical protein [Acinetobacter sp. 251-1]
MKISSIAAIAYSINVAYCASMGDEQLAWNDAPESVKKGIESGVEFHLNNPNITPEQSHEEWLRDKEANGWVYDEVKDIHNKTHPNIVPYSELPPEQRAKDHLFKATVNLLKDLPDPEDYLELSNQLVKSQKLVMDNQKSTTVLTQKQVIGVGVRFIHKNRERFTDHLYGTGLTFERDVTVILPETTALKFLSHTEFERVDALENADVSLVQDSMTKNLHQKQKEEREQEDIIFDEIEAIKGMRTKDAVKEYIKSRYGDEIKENLKLADLQALAIEKVHSFGVI